jgi:carbohydrate-selective porin OprB
VLCKLLLSVDLLIGLSVSAHAQTTSAADAASSAIAGNPGAVNIVAGTGALGRLLGLDPESGLRLGGVLVSDGNYLISGGTAPGKTSFNNLLVAVARLKFKGGGAGAFADEGGWFLHSFHYLLIEK